MPKGARPKLVPRRTCVGCREGLPKRELVRIVRTPEGVRVDPKGKAPGRGAYLHDQRSCWEVGLSGALGRALKTELTEDERRMLSEFMQTLDTDHADQ